MRASEEKVQTRTVLDRVEGFQGEEMQSMGPEIDNGSIEKPKTEVEVQVEISGTSSNTSEASTALHHSVDASEDTAEDGGRSTPKRAFRFWMIMLALAVTWILSTLEGTIVTLHYLPSSHIWAEQSCSSGLSLATFLPGGLSS